MIIEMRNKTQLCKLVLTRPGGSLQAPRNYCRDRTVVTHLTTGATDEPRLSIYDCPLAVAGYQNRDKIAELLGGLGKNTPGAGGSGGLGGLLSQLKTSLGGASAGGLLTGGLGELMERFKQSGQAETADSWVKAGPNKECSPAQLEQAIGPEVLATLSKQTGLAKDELLSRLCRELPRAVDKYTPDGRLPTEAELARA